MPTLDPDFRQLMQQPVVLRRFTGMNEYGKREFGSPENYKAHVQQGFERRWDDDGEYMVGVGRIFFFGHVGLTTDDEVAFDDGTAPRLIGIERWFDEKGENHEVAVFQHSRNV